MELGGAPDPAVVAHILEQMLRDAERSGPGALQSYERRFPRHVREVRCAWRDAFPSVGEGTDWEHQEGLPQRIGPYRITAEIGRGGQGVVYLADDPALSRTVAVKVLFGPVRYTAAALHRFHREGVVLARLRHRAICPILAAGIDRGSPWLAMAHIQGTTLAARLDKWRDRPGGRKATEARIDEALGILEPIADGLAHAHAHDVLHRDVSPRNILIPDDSSAMLIDFGLAAQLDDEKELTRGTDRIGTLPYMAPEQERAIGAVDHRADIFSLGVILAQAVTLEPDMGICGDRIQRDEVEALSAFTRQRRRDLWAVIEAATAKRPQYRYASAALLARDLRALRSGRAVSVRAVGSGQRVLRFARHEPRRASLIAATVLLLAVAGLGAVLALRRAGRVETELHGSRLAGANDHLAAELADAAQALSVGDVVQARVVLARVAPPMRSFAWEHLELLTDSSERSVIVANQPLDRLLCIPGGWIIGARDGTVRPVGARPLPPWAARPDPSALLINWGKQPAGQGYSVWRGDRAIILLRQVGTTGVQRLDVAFASLGGRDVVGAWPAGERGDWLIQGNAGSLWRSRHDQSISRFPRVGSTGAQACGRGILGPKGRRLAIPMQQRGKLTSEVVLLDVRSGQVAHRLSEPEHIISAVAFSSDGLRLLTSATRQRGGDGTRIRVWDVASGTQLAQVESDCGVVHALCEHGASGRIWCGCADGSLRCFDGGLSREIAVARGHVGPIGCVRAATAGRLVTVGDDGTLRTWMTVRAGGVLRITTPPGICRRVLLRSAGCLWRGEGEESLTCWDLVSGRRTEQLDVGPGVHLAPDSVRGCGVMWSGPEGWFTYDPDSMRVPVRLAGRPGRGRLVVRPSTSGPCAISQRADHAMEVKLRGSAQSTVLTGLRGRFIDVAASADMHTVAAIDATGTICVWWRRGAERSRATRHDVGAGTTISLDATRRRVAFSDVKGRVVVWDFAMEQEHVIEPQGTVASVALHPQGDRIAIGTMSGRAGAVTIHLVDDGRRLLALEAVGDLPTALAWTPDGAALAAAGLEGEIRVWETKAHRRHIGTRQMKDLAAGANRIAEPSGALGEMLGRPGRLNARSFRHHSLISQILGTPLRGTEWYRLAAWAGAWLSAHAKHDLDGPFWRGAALVRMGDTQAGLKALAEARRRTGAVVGSGVEHEPAILFSALAYAREGFLEKARGLRARLAPTFDGPYAPVLAELDILLAGVKGQQVLEHLRGLRGTLSAVPAAWMDGGAQALPEVLRRPVEVIEAAIRSEADLVRAVATAIALTGGLAHATYAQAARWGQEVPVGTGGINDQAWRAMIAFRLEPSEAAKGLHSLVQAAGEEAGREQPALYAFLAMARDAAGQPVASREAYNRFLIAARRARNTRDGLLQRLLREIQRKLDLR